MMEHTCCFFGHRKIEVTEELKQQYPHIKRIYRTIYPPYPGESQESYSYGYEETRYAEDLRNARRATYVKRNQMMIDESNFCVIYFDADYQPPKPKQKNSFLPAAQPKSGTKVAYDYAVKKGKTIINIMNIS